MIVKLDVCVMLTRDADTLLKGIQARHTGMEGKRKANGRQTEGKRKAPLKFGPGKLVVLNLVIPWYET